MLDVALADKFIKKAANYTSYKINVMNEKGMIIASSDPTRIGSFHEVAYNIMSADQEIIETISSDRFQGGRIGINMALVYKKKKIGVVGVSGEPDEIRDTALLIKMALETMLEYEAQNKKNYQKQNLKTSFTDALLYQEEADSEGELSAVSEQLGYDPRLIRIPILVCLEKQIDAYKILEQLKNRSMMSCQDIDTVTRNNSIIVFKSFRKQEDIISEFKYIIQEWVDDVETYFAEKEIMPQYFIGTFQGKYKNYRKSYQHCCWLKEFCRKKRQKVNYFYENVGEYINSVVPIIELNRIYAAMCDQLDEETKDSIIEMLDTLHRNNYNLNESSKELFIHKNTLIFRYNKIKSLFHKNPIQSTADRDFFSWLVLYLKKNR